MAPPAPAGTGVPLSDADGPALIDSWESTLRDLIGLAESLDDTGWATPTRCPGWTVGDLVAHTSSIERQLLGLTDPPHEPDWAALAHVTGDFGRWTEPPVDLRRSWPRQQVVAELAEAVRDRAVALRAGPQTLDGPIPSPFGGTAPLDRVLRMRTFDCWVHEQDARTALDRPGHLDSAGAWISANQLLAALPYLWGKAAGAPVGAVLRVEVTGPGVTAVQTVAVGDDGRAGRVGDDAAPDVRVICPWPEYVALGCGRVRAGDLAERISVRADDADLAGRLLAALAITP